MTAKKPRKKKAPVDDHQAEDHPLFEKAERREASLNATVDHNKAHCMEVSLEVNWFTTSKALDKSTAISMLADYDASADSVGMSKKLFSSKHPLVKAANEAKTAIINYRNSVTTVVPKSPPLNVSAEEARKLLEKEPGVRLIETDKIDEFDTQVGVLVGNLQAAIKALNAGLAQVKAFDKENLGKLYKDSDYPERVVVQVRGPKYGEVKYSLDFEKLAPKAYARMQKDLQYRLEGGIELTISDFAKALIDLAKQIANQLGNRIRLKVPRDHALYKLRDGEVVEFVTPENDPDVPAGKVMINVRYTPAGQKKSVTEWFELTPAEYQGLYPYETDERKKLYESSLQNLKDQCQNVSNVAAMLGAAGQPIVDAAGKLDDLLATIGGSNKDVLEELRTSGMVRRQTVKALNELTTALTTQFSTIEVHSERRRSIGKFKNKPKDDEAEE